MARGRRAGAASAVRSVQVAAAAREPMALVPSTSSEAVRERVALIAAGMPASIRAGAAIQSALVALAELQIVGEKLAKIAAADIVTADGRISPAVRQLNANLAAQLLAMRALRLTPQHDHRANAARAAEEAMYRGHNGVELAGEFTRTSDDPDAAFLAAFPEARRQ